MCVCDVCDVRDVCDVCDVYDVCDVCLLQFSRARHGQAKDRICLFVRCACCACCVSVMYKLLNDCMERLLLNDCMN